MIGPYIILNIYANMRKSLMFIANVYRLSVKRKILISLKLYIRCTSHLCQVITNVCLNINIFFKEVKIFYSYENTCARLFKAQSGSIKLDLKFDSRSNELCLDLPKIYYFFIHIICFINLIKL